VCRTIWLYLVIEIDDLRFIERDAAVGCRRMAPMNNFLFARDLSRFATM